VLTNPVISHERQGSVYDKWNISLLTIWQPFWFAMVAILNQKWSPKYKDPAIWAKFGFQHDRVKNWALIISFTTNGTYPWSCVTQICHNGQPSNGGDRTTFEVITVKGMILHEIVSSDLGEIWFPT
jgi:hypothetical protein